MNHHPFLLPITVATALFIFGLVVVAIAAWLAAPALTSQRRK